MQTILLLWLQESLHYFWLLHARIRRRELSSAAGRIQTKDANNLTFQPILFGGHPCVTNLKFHS